MKKKESRNINRSALSTAVKTGVKNILTAGYNGARTVCEKKEALIY
jgi:hypothetical protein